MPLGNPTLYGLIAANNLSDLSNTGTARTNLGLGSGSTPTFAGILAGDGTAAAPSISFASLSNAGFLRYDANGGVGYASVGKLRMIFGRDSFGPFIKGADNATSALIGYQYFLEAGGLSFVAGGENQPITFSPSGTAQVIAKPGYQFVINGTSGTDSILQLQKSGTIRGEFGVNASNQLYIRSSNTGSSGILIDGTTQALTHTIGTATLITSNPAGGIMKLTLSGDAQIASNGGNLTLNSSGGIVEISAGYIRLPGAGNAALASNAAWTSGAGAAVGTLNNAPTAGNPTCWIKINDAGVTRYIPAW